MIDLNLENLNRHFTKGCKLMVMTKMHIKKKVLHVISHQRYANKHQNEITLYTY